MIQCQIRLNADHGPEEIRQRLLAQLRIRPEELIEYSIRKQSIDARTRNQCVQYVYTIYAQVKNEKKILSGKKDKNTIHIDPVEYTFPEAGEGVLKECPLIVGAGPAGLFCAYELARHGYRPLVIERGRRIEERTEDVRDFWEKGRLLTASNVQFGEGGAGAFSDGKLNTLVKDAYGRSREVLDIFIRNGAPEEIGYEAKPHIGTDKLFEVIPSLRREIEAMGGSFAFETCLTDIETEDGRVSAVYVNGGERIPCQALILCIGHSARDTFTRLAEKNIPMEAKPFAVGMRVEHPQAQINENQYHGMQTDSLPPAAYKVTWQCENGRGVYSFCMCPGGYVVNASSEEGRLAVNGMSYYRRDSKNANSAIIVTVTPEDYGGEGPLAGMYFQRRLEEKAYNMGKGNIPQQLFGDFEKGQLSAGYGAFPSCVKGKTAFAPLHELFPEDLKSAFVEGMHGFAGRIRDFDRPDAILSGVESRTSSPVRILRGDDLESQLRGLFPCGEGAGYAGGIMSAAMDGLKCAEAVAKRYRPFDE